MTKPDDADRLNALRMSLDSLLADFRIGEVLGALLGRIEVIRPEGADTAAQWAQAACLLEHAWGHACDAELLEMEDADESEEAP